MRTLSKAIVILVALLLTAMPALACNFQQPPDPAPVALSLYNDPIIGENDTITLFALSLFDSSDIYDLQFNENGSSDWLNFNPLFGPLFGNQLSLTAFTFDQPGIIDLNLRLFNGSNVISDQAELTFHEFQSQMDGYDWFNWVELNWLDNSGSPLDISTALSTWLPWDPNDMVGTTAVPIPGTGLLLSFGVLCLIGRRNSQR